MKAKENVIDLQRRRREREMAKGKPAIVVKSTGSAAPIVDMTERRSEMLHHERREVRRTILTEFIGAYVVVPLTGLLKVALYDISDNGLAFDLDPAAGGFSVGEEVAMRVYLNHQTYFPFVVKVSNARMVDEDMVIRHGANFVKGTVNDVALHHFVKFIETVSASLETDAGDVMVSKLTSG